jgi:hypothetical protein
MKPAARQVRCRAKLGQQIPGLSRHGSGTRPAANRLGHGGSRSALRSPCAAPIRLSTSNSILAPRTESDRLAHVGSLPQQGAKAHYLTDNRRIFPSW